MKYDHHSSEQKIFADHNVGFADGDSQDNIQYIISCTALISYEVAVKTM